MRVEARPAPPSSSGHKPFVHQAKVNALPVNQSGKQLQCFGCKKWGHKRSECPDAAKTAIRPNLPPQRNIYLGRGRGRGQPPKGPIRGPPNPVKVNYVSLGEEAEEQAQIYAALDPSGRNRQYSILEAQGDYEGKPLTFLIDSGSSHSFLSPGTAKRLQLEAQPTRKKLRASLATDL